MLPDPKSTERYEGNINRATQTYLHITVKGNSINFFVFKVGIKYNL